MALRHGAQYSLTSKEFLSRYDRSRGLKLDAPCDSACSSVGPPPVKRLPFGSQESDDDDDDDIPQ